MLHVWSKVFAMRGLGLYSEKQPQILSVGGPPRMREQSRVPVYFPTRGLWIVFQSGQKFSGVAAPQHTIDIAGLPQAAELWTLVQRIELVGNLFQLPTCGSPPCHRSDDRLFHRIIDEPLANHFAVL